VSPLASSWHVNSGASFLCTEQQLLFHTLFCSFCKAKQYTLALATYLNKREIFLIYSALPIAYDISDNNMGFQMCTS